MNKLKFTLLCLINIALLGCSSTSIPNASGVKTKYIDPTRESNSSGVGLESSDVINMADQMIRSILNEPIFVSMASLPRILVDETDFTLDGNTRINRKLITTKLRNGLTQAAKGRMVFVARYAQKAIQAERELKRSGIVDSGTTRLTNASAGVDFKLVGSILTNDERHSNGLTSRYHFVNFELVDMELGVTVWADAYEFKKTGADDVIYR